jgi:tetratricopeptide (TPR) repeat protein
MSGALKYATQALARFHQASRQPLTEHAIILGELGEANSLNGQNQQADRYYQQALQKYAQAGRERSLVANILINNWALVSARAGVPKRALELEARALRSLEQNDAGAPPPAELGCNRAAFLVLIGRYAEAKADYERALRLMHESKLVTFKAYCLLDLAGLAEVSGDRLAARRYLSEGSRLAAPADRRALMIRLALEGRIDLNDGKLAQARAKFGQVVAMKERTPATIRAALGWADVELLSGDAAAAVARSQEALNMAMSIQDGVPYSVHTGHASLMLGRALQARGDIPQARKAFETAITHLSNTVDADHPELLRARRLLASLREK